MRVYHFLNEQYGLEDLRDQRLKLAEIMELNDPFELLCVNLSDKDMRKAFNKHKRLLSKTYGLLCFSKNWKNPVLWAHYTDKHEGLCLGFDIPDKHLIEVSYVKNRLGPPATDEELNEEFVKKVISTKYSDWEYEEEYRIFQLKKNIPFIDFSKELELKEIIIGARSKITRDCITKALGDNNSNIEMFNARASFREFKMVYQCDSARWT